MENQDLPNTDSERRQWIAEGVFRALHMIVKECELNINPEDKKTLRNYRDAVVAQLKNQIGQKKKKTNKRQKTKKIPCRVCGKKFHTDLSLKCHMRTKHDQEIETREPVKPVYPEKGSLDEPKVKKSKNDTRVQKTKNIPCPVCGKKFHANHSLECHMRTKHNQEIEAKEPVKPVCPEKTILDGPRIKKNKKFKNASKANSNMVMCPLCGEKVFRRVKAMQQHYLNAHGEAITEGTAFRRLSEPESSREKFHRDWVGAHPGEIKCGSPGLGRKR